MDYMDTLVYFHNKVFNASKWNSFKFLLEFKTVETRGPFFPFFVCPGHGGVELVVGEDKGGGLLVRFSSRVGGWKEEGRGERGWKSLIFCFQIILWSFFKIHKINWFI